MQPFFIGCTLILALMILAVRRPALTRCKVFNVIPDYDVGMANKMSNPANPDHGGGHRAL